MKSLTLHPWRVLVAPLAATGVIVVALSASLIAPVVGGALARLTLQAFARWSTAALDVIGAPTPDNINTLRDSRDAAYMVLSEFRRALETQRQETH